MITTTSQRQSLTRAIVSRFAGRPEDLRFTATGNHTRRVENTATGCSLDADFSGSRMRVLAVVAAPAPAPAMVPQQAQQQQADAAPARRPEPHPMAPAIEAASRAGFDVYMRADQGSRVRGDTWLLFTDGTRIGYLQVAAFGGGYSLSTVHMPSSSHGTGYSLNDVVYSAEGLTRENLMTAFAQCPSWAFSRDNVQKWPNWAAYAKAEAWAGYIKVAGPAPAPAMVPQQVQQQQADASRFAPDVHAAAADWLGYVSARTAGTRDVSAFDAAVTEAVDSLLRRHVITPRVASCLLTFFDVPRLPVIAATVAMVPMPVQQQQARDMRADKSSLNEGRVNSTRADGTPRKGWQDMVCVDAGRAMYLKTGEVYRLKAGRGGWLETEAGDKLAACRFAPAPVQTDAGQGQQFGAPAPRLTFATWRASGYFAPSYHACADLSDAPEGNPAHTDDHAGRVYTAGMPAGNALYIDVVEQAPRYHVTDAQIVYRCHTLEQAEAMLWHIALDNFDDCAGCFEGADTMGQPARPEAHSGQGTVGSYDMIVGEA